MKKKILIVDDDRYFTDSLSLFLEFEGINVDVINTADELFERINRFSSYDAILLDIMFRRGDNVDSTIYKETGEIFYHEFRKINSEMPIIVVTAKNKCEVSVDFDNPATEYIAKPLSSTIEEILSLVKGL